MSDETSSNSIESSRNQEKQLQRIQAYAGLLIILMAIVAFGAAVYFVVISDFLAPNELSERQSTVQSVLISIMRQNSEATFLVFVAVIGSLVGASLLRSALHASKLAISDEDRRLLEPLIKTANQDAISEYVRVSSLTGGTGFFTKIGFTGLPLVTAMLGLLLITLSLASGDQDASKELMDLAKLVIGAFIGSFVQRSVERATAVGNTPKYEDKL